MRYHKFRFGIIGNIKVLICRMFGHRINDDPAHTWCQRCGLCYEECYDKHNYWERSGKLMGTQEKVVQIYDDGSIATNMNSSSECYEAIRKAYQRTSDIDVPY